MEFLDKYMNYWPILAASLAFLILGFWWRFSAARAMELAQKPLSWVKNYRSGGFPFRRELLGSPKLRWWAFLLALLIGALCIAGRIVNLGMIYGGRPGFLLPSRYALFLALVWTVGAGAVYCLLVTLFDSLWIALPGTLLFAASAAQGHTEGCMLAVSLLFLLLWLRAEKPGFPAELLYLCALLPLAPILALRPALIWLIPCFPLVHWYKLNAQRRARSLSGGKLLLSLLAALLVWALVCVSAAVLAGFLQNGLRLRELQVILHPNLVLAAVKRLFFQIRESMLAVPTRGMLVDLFVDAPLFGFGLWGCCSAWVLGWKRRDARGVFALAVLVVLLLSWLLTGSYALSLGLLLTAACVLRDAHLGKKRWPVIVLTAAGVAWYAVIQIAAWYVPLTLGLVERLV